MSSAPSSTNGFLKNAEGGEHLWYPRFQPCFGSFRLMIFIERKPHEAISFRKQRFFELVPGSGRIADQLTTLCQDRFRENARRIQKRVGITVLVTQSEDSHFASGQVKRFQF